MKKLRIVFSVVFFHLMIGGFAQGLVLDAPMDGNITDITGNNSATSVSTTLVSDRFGNPNSAYTLNGSTSYIDYGKDAVLDLKNGISISLWFKSPPSEAGFIFSRGWNTDGSYAVYLGSNGTLYGYVEGSFYQGTTAVQANVWNHLVFVIAEGSNGIKMYLNGVSIGSFTASGTLSGVSAYNLRVGNDDTYDTYFFKGEVDEFKVFDKALTATDAKVLFGALSPVSSGQGSPDFGNALSFDGDNDFVTIPSAPLNNITAGFTLEAWVKYQSGSTKILRINELDDSYFELGLFGYRTQMNAQWPYRYQLDNTQTIDNNWHHFAITLDTTQGIARYYTDAIQTGEFDIKTKICDGSDGCENDGPNESAVDPSLFKLYGLVAATRGRDGAGFNGGHVNAFFAELGKSFRGEIDELRIWDHARTQEEIAQNRYVAIESDGGLAYRLSFDEGIGNADNSGVTTIKEGVSGTYGELLGFGLTGNSSNWVESNIGNDFRPKISYVFPKSGISGKTIKLYGSRLIANSDYYKVYFGDEIAELISITENVIEVKVPQNLSGLNKVRVLNSYGASDAFDFDVISSNSSLDFSWSTKTIYSESSFYRVLTADINKDGFTDIVGFGNGLKVFKNTDGENFTVSTLETSGEFSFPAIRDYDADGDLDISCLRTSDNRLLIYINDGNGSFSGPAVAYNFSGYDLRAIQSMDLENDGDMDFVSITNASGMLELNALKSESGSYSLTGTLSSVTGGLNQYASTMNDFNNDGFMDLAIIISGSTNNIYYFPNDKSGGFGQVYVGVGTNYGEILTSTDLDNDGWIDFGNIGYQLPHNWWENNQDDTFTKHINQSTRYPITVQMIPGDINGDGYDDFLTGNELRIIQSGYCLSYYERDVNNSNGFVFRSIQNQIFDPLDMQLADFDNDGDLDIAVITSKDNKLTVLSHVLSGTDFTSFKLDEQVSSATYDTDSHTIDITVKSDARIAKLYPQFEISLGASISLNGSTPITGETVVDFSDPVIFTITAENGDTQDWKVNAHLLPENPTVDGAETIAQTGAFFDWDNSTNANGYEVTIVDASSTVLTAYNKLIISNSQIAVTGLSAGSRYGISVRAKNDWGYSATQKPLYFVTVPTEPSLNTVKEIGQTKAVVSWSKVTGATSYELDISDDDFLTFLPGYEGFAVNNLAFVVNSLEAGTNYKARLKAVNESGESEYSTVVPFQTVPETPVLDDPANITQSSFVISWDGVTGADSYFVYVYDRNMGAVVDSYNGVETTDLSMRIENLNLATQYEARVQSANESGKSPFSSAVTAVTIPGDPNLNEASELGQTTVVLSWTEVSRATGYELDVSSDDFVTFLAGYEGFAVNNLSFVVNTLTAGSTYKARLRSVNESGVSGNSDTITFQTIPATPVLNEAANIQQTNFSVSWDAVNGADSYFVYVIDRNTNKAVDAYDGVETTELTLLIENLNLATFYDVKVQSANGSGKSPRSSAISVVTRPGNPSFNDVSDFGQSSVVLNWPEISGASSYELDVSADDFVTFLAGYEGFAVNNLSFVVSSLNPGGAYKARLRSVNESGVSGNSETISFRTIPATPVLNEVTNIKQTSFDISWDEISGADSYLIYVSIEGSGLVVPTYYGKKITGTSISLVGLNNATNYKVRLKSTNESGNSPFSKQSNVITIPANPTLNQVVSVGQTSAVIDWPAVSGATSYELDVTNNLFTSFLPGFEGFSVNNLAFVVTGLEPGTIYRARLRSVNESGISGNSAFIAFQTIPETPELEDASQISASGFKVEWTEIAGADNYLIYLFNRSSQSIVSAYNGKSVTGTSYTITGLNPASVYDVTMKSSNEAGNSVFSTPISALTLAEAPVIEEVSQSDITQTGAVVEWSVATGADDYLFEVSADNFLVNVVGYNPKVTTASTEVLSTLSAGKNYSVRIRSRNASGNSVYSDTVYFTTLPGTPVVRDATSITPTSFNANWDPVTGDNISYYVELAHSPKFDSIVSSKDVSGAVSASFTNLKKGYSHWYRVKSNNNTGSSPFSAVIAVEQGLLISDVVVASEVNQNNSGKIPLTFKATGGSNAFLTTLRYKGSSEVSWNEVSLAGNKEQFAYEFARSDFDKVGLKFEIVLTDGENILTSSQYEIIWASIEDEIPIQTVGGGWQLFSIPYVLEDNTITNVFSDLGDKKYKVDWRMMHFSNDRYLDVGSGISTIDLGKGYWFNSKVPVDLTLENSKVNSQTPFELELKAGWNQIGNPFNVPISWGAIRTANGVFGNVSELFKYDPAVKNFVEADVLDAFEGGFVYCEQSVDLEISLTASKAAGRTLGDVDLTENAPQGWRLAIGLSENNQFIKLATVGMESDARLGKEEYDLMAIPRFVYYTRMFATHDALKLSRDIRPENTEESWLLDFDSNDKTGIQTLTWQHENLEQSGNYWLIDEITGARVNMTATDSYSFQYQEGYQFSVHYLANGIKPNLTAFQLHVGKPYPNPASQVVNVALDLPKSESGHNVLLEITDLSGKVVLTEMLNEMLPGLREVTLDVSTQSFKSGIYFYKIQILNGGYKPVVNKMIIQKD